MMTTSVNRYFKLSDLWSDELLLLRLKKKAAGFKPFGSLLNRALGRTEKGEGKIMQEMTTWWL